MASVQSSSGAGHRPTQDHLTELTLRGFILGALITVVFTSSNVYLGLKVGLTFSSSIPAAVISMAALSFFSRSNILENNMVQTQASAAGTLSAVIFVLPAILMVGYWNNFHFWQTMLICMAGGALGVIFSIPLRRTMVVNSELPYPEGVAAAEILRAGHQEETGSGGAKDIAFGGVLAAIVSVCTGGLHLLTDKASLWLNAGKAVFHLPVGFSLALVSAGYLMGLTAGLAMLIGAFLAWGVFVPYFTWQLPALAGSISDTAMSLWSSQVRFIGAGTIAVAAVWTLLTLFKPMAEGIRLSFKAIAGSTHGLQVERTDRDLSMRTLIWLTAALVAVLAAVFYSFVEEAPIADGLAWGLVALSVIMAFIIGFFIAAACGYMAGLIGSSNSPISGIGIIAIIVVSAGLVFLDGGMRIFLSPEGQRFGMGLAIFVTTAVVSVATISNDNLQDLKTGYLIGATPRNQQIALLVGCAVGAAVIAPVLSLLYQAYGFAGAPLARPDMDTAALLSAPQATLMKTVTQGIFSHNLDWSMLGTGLAVGALVIIGDRILGKFGSKLRISALAVGLGLYLPPSITAAIIVGSFLNLAVKRRRAARGLLKGGTDEHSNRGILIASGFIVGESLTGVVLAIVVLVSLSMGYSDTPLSLANLFAGLFGGSFSTLRVALSLLVFVGACTVFYKKSTGK
ncbi:MAG: oligopeptide transporter, OPT family [Deltaproteobacteria bacterium]|jgi:putative OPT family oligopeptide transporter|nr:oligopeptide transporter, OPT family [Deltaproteobacteria bacterium]